MAIKKNYIVREKAFNGRVFRVRAISGEAALKYKCGKLEEDMGNFHAYEF